MGEPPVLTEVVSVRGYRMRLTLRQWLHISENHDYMAGNKTLVLETIADLDELLAGEAGETLALRAYPQTNLTAKTAVVVSRDEPDGFIITAWLTSRADRVRATGVQVWTRSPSISDSSPSSCSSLHGRCGWIMMQRVMSSI